MRTTRAFGCLCAIFAAATLVGSARAVAAPPLSVAGAKLVQVNPDGTQTPVQRRGVTGTGALFNCIGGYGIFDGATDAAYMAAMKTWAVEIVRVPMNEDCWLGVNGVPAAMGGPAYQAAMKTYVDALVAFGFNVILELHWTAAGSQRATGQQPMPDRDHAVPFWQGVAAAFGRNRAVVFDLFNEPFPGDNTWDSAPAWACWRDGGGNCSGLPYTAVGMQGLVTAVRAAGAENVLMLGGISYSNSLSRWVEYMPADPLRRLAASWHSYSTNICNNELCWDLYVAPVLEHAPVVTGELGENDCRGEYIKPLMTWLDGRSVSYLAWLWAPWDCKTGPALITSYNGSCTDSYGCDYRDHLLSRNNSAGARP